MDIYVKKIPGKGRGIFAGRRFKRGEVIEKSPLILIDRHQLQRIDDTVLYHYYFGWGENHADGAIALGYGSLFNHSYQNNAKYIRHAEEIHFVALNDIDEGEEITINYNGETADQMADVGFAVHS